MVMTYGVRCHAKNEKKSIESITKSIYHERELSNPDLSFLTPINISTKSLKKSCPSK